MDILPRMSDIGTLFSDTWKQYVQGLKRYLVIQLIPLAAGGVFLVLLLAGEGIAGGIIMVVALLALIIVSIWASAALLYAVTHPEQALTFKDSFREAWKRAGAFLWVSVLGGLLTLGASLLLVIPGIIVAMWVAFGAMVVMTEEDRGLNALAKSREYVRGFWGAVFGRTLLIALVSGAVYLIPNIILGILIPGADVLYGIAVSLFLTPFTAVYSYVMLKQLKAIKGPVALGEQTQRSKKIIVGLALGGVGLVLLLTLLAIYASM